MRRRLLVSTALIALAAVLVLGLPLGLVGSRLLRADDEQRLEREADAAAGRIAQALAAHRAVDAQTLDAMATADHRLEVVLPDGRRIAGGAVVDDPHALRVRAGSDAGARVTVVAPSSDRNAETGAVWLAVIVLSLVAVAVAVALALVQGRRLARPLERLAAQAGGIGSRAPVMAGSTGIEEVDRVGDALADAGRRVSDALRREREFSANASHQLRSPLTALRMRLEVLSDSAQGDVHDEATAALEQSDRLMATIEQLERFAAGDREPAPVTDLALLATVHAAGTWTGRFAAQRRTLTVAPHRGVTARMTPEAARQVLDVLLDNALQHGDGPVRVELARDAGWARLAVQDAGPGVPDGDTDRVFARRWSGAGGSGIGLALARDLVRDAGGDLALASSSPTRFEAVLPAGLSG